MVSQDRKVQNPASSQFLLLIIIRSDCLTEIWWSVCISKSQRSLFVSFSWMDSGLSIYHLFVWWNFNFLLYSQLIVLPTQSCLVFAIIKCFCNKELSRRLEVSEFEPKLYYADFRTNSLANTLNPTQLLVKKYRYLHSTIMPLALKIPKRLRCYGTKKPNQTKE